MNNQDAQADEILQNPIPKNAWHTYWRLAENIKNYKLALSFALCGVILASIAEALIYKFIAPQLFDQGVIAKDPVFLKLAPWYILATFILRGSGDFLGKYFMAFVGRNVVKDQRIAILKHLLYLPVAFFDHHNSGELIAKITYDAEQVATALADSVLELCKGIATIILLLGVMFSISWHLTLTVLVLVPLLGKYFKAISVRIRRYSTRVQAAMGQVTNVAHEIINAHKVIRAFQGESQETARINTTIKHNCNQEIKVALVMACSEPVMQLIGAIALAGLVYLATLNSLQISPGEFIGLFGAMFGLIRPIKQITQVNNVLQRGIAAASSIQQLLAVPTEIDTGTQVLTNAKGCISFQEVGFSYIKHTKHGHRRAALKNINFTAAAGQTIALIGNSGGGKTTLVSLLPRFYDLTAGKIYIDGIDIKDLTLASLRRQIALVTQHVVLFNDTIANNIAYAKPGATRDEILQAATAAHILEFADKFPDGLHTFVGQDGALLSGGQRQRIAIARALLKNAPILILDEATSALDVASERYIQEALAKLMGHCTTLVIAHRLSTIEKADQILVLEHGSIVEFGTHAELIAKDSRYATLQQIS